MVAPAPKDKPGTKENTPLPSKESDNGESYEATQEDTLVSDGDIEIAVRVAHATEVFTGQCFRCNKVGHQFYDNVCKMYNQKFLNISWGPAKSKVSWQAPE